jgi:hypothetical protein
MKLSSRLPPYATALAAYWREALLLAASVIATLMVLEIGYRLYQHQTLPGRLFALVDAEIRADYDARTRHDGTRPYRSDQHTGYLYAPNFEGRRGHPWHSRWRSNSHGHVSKFEYPRQKPPGEYRIAIIGDSMVANITNNIRWTEALEDLLNAAPQWRRQAADRFTRVINFGVDGMGMVQFAAMVRHHVMPFEPDMVIVNFISDSILRRLRHLPTPPSSSSDRDAYVRNYVKTYVLDHIDWFSPRMELLATTVGRRLRMQAALPWDAKELLGSAGPLHKYASRSEALAASSAAVRDILEVFPDALFLQMPLWEEMDNRYVPQWHGLVDELRKRVPQANFASMHPAMSALLQGKRLSDRPDLAGLKPPQLFALPTDQKLEMHRWFYLPDDGHYTDYGTALYAREVANYLIESRLPPSGSQAQHPPAFRQ